MKKFSQFIKENALKRVNDHFSQGRPFTVISAQRYNLSPEENTKRHEELKKVIGHLGYGFRPVKGVWEGGSESSLFVTPKDKDDPHFRNDMEALGRAYEQDAILYHSGNSNHKGSIIATRDNPEYNTKAGDLIDTLHKVSYTPKGDKTVFKKGEGFSLGK